MGIIRNENWSADYNKKKIPLCVLPLKKGDSLIL